MKNTLILATFTTFLFSCNWLAPQKAESNVLKEKLAPVQEADKNGLTIPSELLGKIQNMTKGEIQPFKREVWKYDKEGNEEHYTIDQGIYFDFVNETTAHEVFLKFTDQVRSGGNYIFLTEMDFDDDYNTYYDVVILPNSDPFEIIKRIGTHGINYDRYNTDILEKLRKWHEDVQFDIVVIDQARIHAYMKNRAYDMKGFANEVYDFCPDVIDQGYGSMEEMVQDYKLNKYFWLWWD